MKWLACAAVGLAAAYYLAVLAWGWYRMRGDTKIHAEAEKRRCR
jgi:hypothetical protein